MKKKYLMINQMSYANLAQYDYNFLLEMKKNLSNYDFIYICSSLYDLKKLDQVKIIKIFNYSSLKNIFIKLSSYFLSSIKLLLLIAKTKPDLVHFQWIKFQFIDLFIILISKFIFKSKLIFTVHNAKERRENFFIRISNKIIFLNIDYFIFHTYRCRNLFLSNFKEISKNKTFILRHGTLNYRSIKFKPYKDDLSLLNNFHYKTKNYDKKYIFIGKGSYYKGLDILIEAWMNLNENELGNSCLIIAGKVDNNIYKKYKKFFQKKIYNNVIFNHKLSDYFLSNIIENIDYILIPHKFISHSGVFSSFLEYKKPFIYSSSEKNHMNESKYFRNTGFSFDGSILDLKNLIKNINKDYPQIEVTNWSKAINFYNWENIISESKFVTFLKNK